MTAENPFSSVDPSELARMAEQRGFSRKGQRKWVRRTSDFIQMVNLQVSQWSSTEHYLNFALWPLVIGEPQTLAESKFHFRTRGEDLGASDLGTFFVATDGLGTLAELRDAESAGRITGLMTKQLRDLLP